MVKMPDTQPDVPGTPMFLGAVLCADKPGRDGQKLRRALSPFGPSRQGTSLPTAGYHAIKIDGRFAAINPSTTTDETSAMGAPSGTRAWSPPV